MLYLVQVSQSPPLGHSRLPFISFKSIQSAYSSAIALSSSHYFSYDSKPVLNHVDIIDIVILFLILIGVPLLFYNHRPADGLSKLTSCLTTMAALWFPLTDGLDVVREF